MIVNLTRPNPPKIFFCWLVLSTFTKNLSGLIRSAMEVMLLHIFIDVSVLAATVGRGTPADKCIVIYVCLKSIPSQCFARVKNDFLCLTLMVFYSVCKPGFD